MAEASNYEEGLKAFQAKALADLQKLLAEPEKTSDPRAYDRKVFAIELIRARQSKHLSQSMLAAKTGMRQPDISRIESGRANPSLNTLLAIAEALDAHVVIEY